MPFGRRRPLMRAAAVGGIAYTASRRGAMAGQQQAEEQEQAPPEAYAPPPPSPVPAQPPAQAPEDSAVAKIEQLAKLHESGVLTDEEFSAAKAKALGIN